MKFVFEFTTSDGNQHRELVEGVETDDWMTFSFSTSYENVVSTRFYPEGNHFGTPSTYAQQVGAYPVDLNDGGSLP